MGNALDRRMIDGDIPCQRRTYFTDRDAEACRSALVMRNIGDVFACESADIPKVFRFSQLKGELTGIWLGHSRRLSDYVIVFQESSGGTFVSLRLLEAGICYPLSVRQMDAFFRAKLDARPV